MEGYWLRGCTNSKVGGEIEGKGVQRESYRRWRERLRMALRGLLRCDALYGTIFTHSYFQWGEDSVRQYSTSLQCTSGCCTVHKG
jgi:hypothetical protein